MKRTNNTITAITNNPMEGNSMNKIISNTGVVNHNGIKAAKLTEASEGFALRVRGHILSRAVSVDVLLDADFMPDADRSKYRIGVDTYWNTGLSARMIHVLEDFHPDQHLIDNSTMNGAGQKLLFKLLKAAFHAAIYEVREGYVLELTLDEPKEDDILYKGSFASHKDSSNLVEFYIRRKYTYYPLRPLAHRFDVLPIMHHQSVIRLNDDDRKALLSIVAAYMKSGSTPKAYADDTDRRGAYAVVGDKDNAWFAAPVDRVVELLRRLGVYETGTAFDIRNNRHTLRRVGVLLGRTGSVHIPLMLHGEPLDIDGTIYVGPMAGDLMQGTFFTEDLRAEKGTVRFQVFHDGHTERAGFAAEGQLGRTLHEGDTGTFYIIRRAEEENATTNLQAVAFTAADQGREFFTQMTRRMKTAGVEMIAGRRGQKFIEAGMSPDLVVDDRDVTRHAYKFDLKAGYRGMVIGVGRDEDGNEMLDEDEVLIPLRIKRRIEKERARVLKRGDVLRIKRDPALPDGSGIQEFRYAGVLQFTDGSRTWNAHDGVAVSAYSGLWAVMGGDFDGDAAEVVHPELDAMGELYRINEAEHMEVRSDINAITSVQERGAVTYRGNLSLSRTLIANNSGWSNAIGIVMSRVQKLWGYTGLADDVRMNGTVMGQGTISAKKHEVDIRRLEKLDRFFDDLLDQYEDRDDVIAFVSQLKKATGELTDEAWEELVEFAGQPHQHMPLHMRSFLSYIQELDRKIRDLGLYRRGDGTMPSDIRQAARFVLDEEVGVEAAADQLAKAWTLYRRYVGACINLAQAEDEEARKVLSNKIDAAKALARASVKKGVVSAYAFLAHRKIKSSFVVEVVEPEHVRRCGVTQQQHVVRGFAKYDSGEETAVTPGVWNVEELCEYLYPDARFVVRNMGEFVEVLDVVRSERSKAKELDRRGVENYASAHLSIRVATRQEKVDANAGIIA